MLVLDVVVVISCRFSNNTSRIKLLIVVVILYLASIDMRWMWLLM